MNNGAMKLQHTNGDVEIFDNSATPGPVTRQKDLQVEHIDTDIELDSDAGDPYKTPVALQKKKRTMPAPVIESSDGEDTEVLEQKKIRNRDRQPVVSLRQI